MIAIVNYGSGNILSVKNAFDYLGEDCQICNSPEELINAEKIILPGVGSFPDCMKNLIERKFVDVLKEKVLINKTPILGICLGMQIMAKMGFEMKKTEGLGWFDAKVIKINSSNTNFKIPNIGWENIEYKPNGILFNNSQVILDFYFVHSYFMKCNNDDDMTSWYYLDNQKITASIQKENIFGTQFHPEKSSDYGREVLIKFIEY
jgi:imidazole glycerol-phosphate synthase subunit HisH